MFSSLRRRAMRRGPLGGSRQWTLLWALLLAARLFRRFTKGKEEVVFSHRLQPGERVVISHDDSDPKVIGGR